MQITVYHSSFFKFITRVAPGLSVYVAWRGLQLSLESLQDCQCMSLDGDSNFHSSRSRIVSVCRLTGTPTFTRVAPGLSVYVAWRGLQLSLESLQDCQCMSLDGDSNFHSSRSRIVSVCRLTGTPTFTFVRKEGRKLFEQLLSWRVYSLNPEERVR